MLPYNDGRVNLHNAYAGNSVSKDQTTHKQYLNTRTMQTKFDYIPELRRLHLHNVIYGLPFGVASMYPRDSLADLQ